MCIVTSNFISVKINPQANFESKIRKGHRKLKFSNEKRRRQFLQHRLQEYSITEIRFISIKFGSYLGLAE